MLLYKTLLECLKILGIEKGDTLLIQSSLPQIGLIERINSKKEFLEFYFKAFTESVGPEGTILVHTPFEDYGRYGVPFTLETSPSSAGIFSEFIRTQPHAIRSLHPIVSIAGIGPLAKEICGGPHFEGFGWESPWGRIHRKNIKIIGLGVGFSKTLSFTHFIESMYNVPYDYIKLFETPVYCKGKRVEGVFTMKVRYLDFSIEYNVIKFENALIEKGIAFEKKLGRGIIQIAKSQDIFNFGIECLTRDRYFFLKQKPLFRAGEYPFDGITGEKKDVYNKKILT